MVEEDIEDLELCLLMQQADRNDIVDRAEVMNALNE